MHVLVTLLVILSTANHYLLDAVAAFVLVLAADRVAGAIHPDDEHEVVASADAFFLHVEESGDPTDFDAPAWTATWLDRPLPALGGRKPADFMDTAEGQQLVSNLIARMQSGAYA